MYKKNERLIQVIFDQSKNKTLPILEVQPLVSVLMLNRNGLEHLKRFFQAYPENTIYKNVEFIIVDNDSSDDSINYLKQIKDNFNIKLIENKRNETFSYANNQAEREASGEYVLLLNNDVVPTKGWLTQMVATLQSHPDVGAVGSRLIYPNKASFKNSCKVQHAGLHFQKEKGLIRPYNSGNGFNWNDEKVSITKKVPGVTAACLLVERKKYIEVEGLTESYVYGYEDVDFCLKLDSKGYQNLYCSDSILFHYEFGTQSKDTPKDVQDRRYNNIVKFREFWYDRLNHNLFEEKFSLRSPYWGGGHLHIAFAVTDNEHSTTAGDFFTALELGQELEKKGVEVSYLSRVKHQWYDFDESIDVVISLLDAYNPKQVETQANPLFVAWARNWFERWSDNPNIQAYDIHIASSRKAQSYMSEKLKRDVAYLPIATNPERFNKAESNKNFESDYCFTGSRWGEPRTIESCLNPSEIDFKFKVFGANWDQSESFSPFNSGFINYDELPAIYKSTKLLIDDANRVTCEWGSVNSRVFDALGQGVLCVTNGVFGSEEIFDGKLPTYQSKEDLHGLIQHYLSNPSDAKELASKLQQEVLSNHTYEIRAVEILDLLKQAKKKQTLAILSPSPNEMVAKEWGDYHLALAIKKYMERRGVNADVFHLQEWGDLGVLDYKNTFVLRGLSEYSPKPFQNNIMWLISHPDKISVSEMNKFDHVFIASYKFLEQVKDQLTVPASVMLQCTDLELMKPDYQEEYAHDILLIGNSRKVLRDSVAKLLGEDLDVSVYGNHWQDLIPSKWIKGVHVNNTDLKRYYSSANILLNDHWGDMKDQGFISNRIFDALACRAHLVTDRVQGLDEVFSTPLCIYDTKDDLIEWIDKFHKKEPEVLKHCEDLHHEVIKYHGYENRIDQISNVLV